MVRLYGFSCSKLDVTQGAPIFLLLEQPQPLLLVGCPSHVSLLALYPVLAQGWVLRRTFSLDLDDAGEWGCIRLHHCRLSLEECPGAIVPNVACFPPVFPLVRVSACRPIPEHVPLYMSSFVAAVFGDTVPVRMRPTPENGMAFFDYLPRRGLLMCVQGGSSTPHVCEDLCLVWDGQPFALLPALPEVQPKEVQPVFEVHSPGFGFVPCQSSCLEERFSPWSGLGFPYCPCRSRDHQVVGLSHTGSACVESSAMDGGCGSPLRVCCVEHPFHPLQCPMRQPWGHDPALWRARVRGRDEADVDSSCFEPLAQRGGAYGHMGHQRVMVNVVKAAAHLRVEHPWTTVLTTRRLEHGLHRLPRAAPWSQARGVCCTACLPFWLQSRLADGLHDPVLAGRYAQGSVFPVVLRDVHPSDRLGCIPLQAQVLLQHLPAGFGSVVHPSIHPCRVSALVFLGHTSDRQECVGRSSHKHLLEIFPFSPCLVPRGAVETFLHASYIPFPLVPLDVRPCGVGVFFGPFREHPCRTSPRMRTLLACSLVRPQRQSAPFRVGYPHLCGPIRPATERRSLFPSSSPLCSIPLPCGQAPTSVGSRGLTQLSVQEHVARLGWRLFPGEPSWMSSPPLSLRRSCSPIMLVLACQPLWPWRLHEVFA